MKSAILPKVTSKYLNAVVALCAVKGGHQDKQMKKQDVFNSLKRTPSFINLG
jgi:hypothetical protein